MLVIYLAYLLIISAITFFCYGIDKGQAKRRAYRISEKFLLTLSILGGAFGGLFAMQRFRHKTRHWYFTIINVLGIIIHLGILAFLGFFN